jgi:hypothetical protein
VQCMRWFSSFGWFASAEIVRWAAMEVVRIASKLTVLCMGIFPTYHVKLLTERVSQLFVSFIILCHFFFFFSFVQLPAAFVLPSREALCLGDRVVMYLPRCADTNSEVRKVSAQVSDWQAALLVSNKLILWTAIVTIIYMLKCISCISILPNFLLFLVEKSHKLLFG